MRSLDTNIAVRFLLNDADPQVAVAKQMFSEPSMLLPTVILEDVWVLTSVSGWPRDRIVEGIATLLSLPAMICVDARAVRWALARYAVGADFADVFHLALSDAADSFATFDRRIARHADASVVPVETLTA